MQRIRIKFILKDGFETKYKTKVIKMALPTDSLGFYQFDTLNSNIVDYIKNTLGYKFFSLTSWQVLDSY